VQTVTVRPASGSAYATNSLFQLLGRGQQAVITSTDASRIFSSVAYRAASVCNNAAVTGSYAGLETGINYSPSDVFAGVGAGVGDGQGNMAYTYNVNDMALGMVSAPNTHGIYSIASDCTGTATLNGRPHVVGLVLGGRIVAMEITSGSDPATGYLDPVGAVTNVPHIGVNGGWDTNVILVNPGSLAATVQVNFFGDDGNPLQLPLIAPGSTSSSLRSSMSVSVPAHASASVSTAGSPSASNIGGWAQINGSREITAYAVFGWPLNGNASNGLTQAVSYDACVSNTSVTVPFDNSGGRIFGIGVANPGSAVANIAVTVTDATGRLIGQGSQGSVPVNGHTQFLLSQLVPATSGIGGTVSLTSSAGPLAVTALQFNSNGSFTSVPIACR
jgi:hypothetical protein